MDTYTNPRAKRRQKMLVAAGVALLIALSVLIPSTVRFFASTFPIMTSPVAEFDENEAKTFVVGPDDSRLGLCINVEHRDDPVPEMNVVINGGEEGDIQTERVDGWMRMLGREHRRFLEITAGDAETITIEVDVTDESYPEGRADFTVFRHPDTVFERHALIATPYWIGGAVPLVLAVGLFGAALVSRITDQSDMPMA